MIFAGKGPRDDGRIYLADYGVQWSYQGDSFKPDTSAQVQTALNDAGLLCTEVVWPAGVFFCSNLIVPQGVSNRGVGRDFNGNRGTTLVGTRLPGTAMFTLAQGGPFIFKHMTLKAAEKAIYAPLALTALTLQDMSLSVSSPTGISLHSGSTSAYPVRIRDFNISGGAVGIQADSHLGSLTLIDGKMASQSKYGIMVQRLQPCVVNQFDHIEMIDFSIPGGPCMYFDGPFLHLDISRVCAERYPNADGSHTLADIVFGPNIGGGHFNIHDNVLGAGNGLLCQYAIYNMPSGRLSNNAFGTPVAAKYPVGITDDKSNSGLAFVPLP